MHLGLKAKVPAKLSHRISPDTTMDSTPPTVGDPTHSDHTTDPHSTDPTAVLKGMYTSSIFHSNH